MIGAELDEPADGAVAAPVDLARRAFDMVPQDIAGDDGDAAAFILSNSSSQ